MKKYYVESFSVNYNNSLGASSYYIDNNLIEVDVKLVITNNASSTNFNSPHGLELFLQGLDEEISWATPEMIKSALIAKYPERFL